MSVSFQTNPSFLDVLLLHDLAGGTLVPCSAGCQKQPRQKKFLYECKEEDFSFSSKVYKVATTDLVNPTLTSFLSKKVGSQVLQIFGNLWIFCF